MKKKKSDRIYPQNHIRDSFEDFRTLSHKIMFLALHGLLRTDFLQEASRILLEFSGCNSVGLWLEERDKYYWSEVTRSRKQPFHLEIMHTLKNEEGKKWFTNNHKNVNVTNHKFGTHLREIARKNKL